MTAPSIHARFSPAQLLVQAQSTDALARAAQEQLIAVFDDDLRKSAGHTCRRYFLHSQERDEVLAETYQQIVNPAIARFAPHRGKPEHYLRGLVQNSARKVNTQVRPIRRFGLCDSMECAANTRCSRQSPDAAAEARDTVAFILKSASPRMRRVLRLLFWKSWPVQRVAIQMGMNRFALVRQLNAFFEQMRVRLTA